MKKKIFALLFLSVSLVTGCGSKKDDKKEDKKDTEEKEEVKEEEFDLGDASNLISLYGNKVDLSIFDQGIPKLTLAIYLSDSTERKNCADLFTFEGNHYEPISDNSLNYCDSNEGLAFYSYDDLNKIYKELFNEDAPKESFQEYIGNGKYDRYVGYSEKLNGYAIFEYHRSAQKIYSEFVVESASIKDDILTINLAYENINDFYGKYSVPNAGVGLSWEEASNYVKENIDQGKKITIKYKKIDDKFYLIDSSKSE